ncbi:MAG TPA: methyl-accepting chemotaxis protein [Gemmatimonadaceae bacterium]|nr:methyl-accepting chemotaxis protein [Gemmatimonadaceae bacterium]
MNDDDWAEVPGPADAARRLLKDLRDRGAGLTTIEGRLRVGVGLLFGCLLLAGGYGWWGMTTTTARITETLTGVEEDSHLSSQLTAKVTQSLEAAGHYLAGGEAEAAAEFRALGWTAHRIQREMGARGGQTPPEVEVIARIDRRVSEMEVRYARAHRVSDLGRVAQAAREAARARPVIDSLLGDIERLGQMKARKLADAAAALRVETTRRSATLFGVIVLAIVLAAAVVFPTLRSVTTPLRALVAQAKALAVGDYTVRAAEDMPGEFRELADVLNFTGESLAKTVDVVAQAAENVASSANELSSVSDQISKTSSEMSAAMTNVTAGADGQARHLRDIDVSLETIRARARRVLDGAEEVNALAAAIRDSSVQRRGAVEQAMTILLDVKQTVQTAALEVKALNGTAADINRFVEVVRRIAEQTNLLALNAAIEAARAGEAGQGFAVVADEVRHLAEQAQDAADDIVRMTGAVTARVASTSRVMETGAARVGEIERVSRDIGSALSTITEAAERTRTAADVVTEAADENVRAVEHAADGIASIAKTAEGHAATAEQVSAATQEQSAACEQMNSASAQLLEGSTLLKELVHGLRAGA